MANRCTIKGKTYEGGSQRVVFLESGRKLVYIVPKYNGPTIIIKNAYDDDVWASNGSDKQNYDKQMATTMKLLGGDPKIHTAHHERPTGKKGKDLVMRLVLKKDHKERHYGASLMANSNKRRQHIKDAGNWDISVWQRIINCIDFYSHKYPNETAALIGCSSALVTSCIVNKISPKIERNKRIGISLVVGGLITLATRLFLKSKDTYYV